VPEAQPEASAEVKAVPDAQPEASAEAEGAASAAPRPEAKAEPAPAAARKPRKPRKPVAAIKTDQAAFAANVAKEVSKSLVPPPVLYAVAIGVIVFVLWLATR
jgi:hypothetical protein